MTTSVLFKTKTNRNKHRIRHIKVKISIHDLMKELSIVNVVLGEMCGDQRERKLC